MSKMIRSARGEIVDFELFAIKQQLSSASVPKSVEDRKRAIDIKDGVKPSTKPDIEFLAISKEAAEISNSSTGKQLKRK